MLKIDQAMADAIRYKENYKSKAIEVKQVCHNLCIVKYCGQVIGRIEDTTPKPFVKLTLNGHNTQSTRSRVNAILGLYNGGKVSCVGGAVVFSPNPLADAEVVFDEKRGLDY